MKKYLVVISYCEEETYLFNTKKDMFDFFNVKSIKELINKSSLYSSYYVYEVSKMWEDNYEKNKK